MDILILSIILIIASAIVCFALCLLVMAVTAVVFWAAGLFISKWVKIYGHVRHIL